MFCYLEEEKLYKNNNICKSQLQKQFMHVSIMVALLGNSICCDLEHFNLLLLLNHLQRIFEDRWLNFLLQSMFGVYRKILKFIEVTENNCVDLRLY